MYTLYSAYIIHNTCAHSVVTCACDVLINIWFTDEYIYLSILVRHSTCMCPIMNQIGFHINTRMPSPPPSFR